MGTFSDELHELCQREMERAIQDEGSAATMTAELASQLANAIAVASYGRGEIWRPALEHTQKVLPQLVFRKAALVRDELAAIQAEGNP